MRKAKEPLITARACDGYNTRLAALDNAGGLLRTFCSGLPLGSLEISPESVRGCTKVLKSQRVL